LFVTEEDPQPTPCRIRSHAIRMDGFVSGASPEMGEAIELRVAVRGQ